mgnify:FL=1|jgi:hypothetical protein
MNGLWRKRTTTPLVLRAVALGLILLPAVACGPGGSVYVGVSAPGPWTSYPGGYYPGAWGYPGYRWEEEDQDAPDPLDWEAPWAQSPTPPLTLPDEDAS